MMVSSLSVAFAESVYDINIPSGSADVDAPFHWSSEKDGDTSGFIEIVVNDTIFWRNGDTVAHTVTSGKPLTGPDGVFESGKIGPGKFFLQKFEEVGEFPYYCTIHPWRTGLVSVLSGYSVVPNVALDVGDGSSVFNLEYKFNRIINRVNVDEDEKTITLELRGNSINDDKTMTLLLPPALISGISSVSVDDNITESFTQEFEDEITIMVINEIPNNAKSITITGATIVPEFAGITMIILISSIAMMIWMTRNQLIVRLKA